MSRSLAAEYATLSTTLPAQTAHGLIRGTRATLYGSEGWGFESLRARPGQRPLPIMEGAFVLTLVLTAATRRPSGRAVVRCQSGDKIIVVVGLRSE
jgi:hypothetical protein